MKIWSNLIRNYKIWNGNDFKVIYLDLDIDAVSLASFTFDKSGRYIAHSPFANIDTIENLEASEEIPFPTGK